VLIAASLAAAFASPIRHAIGDLSVTTDDEDEERLRRPA